MDEKRASGRAKRPPKPVEEGNWDCSVCTYKNSAEAYKCEMCDVRKGTSTRKPRINPQLVAQQVAQQFAAPLTPPPGSPTSNDDFPPPFPDPVGVVGGGVVGGVGGGVVLPPLPPDRLGPPPPPPPKPVPKKEKSFTAKREKSNAQQKSNTQVKKKPRSSTMKNADQGSARQMSVTVDNVTVVITDYMPKKRKVASAEQSKNNVQSDASDSSSNASNDVTEEHSFTENHT